MIVNPTIRNWTITLCDRHSAIMRTRGWDRTAQVATAQRLRRAQQAIDSVATHFAEEAGIHQNAFARYSGADGTKRFLNWRSATMPGWHASLLLPCCWRHSRPWQAHRTLDHGAGLADAIAIIPRAIWSRGLIMIVAAQPLSARMADGAIARSPMHHGHARAMAVAHGDGSPATARYAPNWGD